MIIGNNIGIHKRFRSSGAPSPTLPLDGYSPDAAYATILLKSDYSGALVKLRRSSDSATKDFYPDGNNELSMSSEDGAGTSLSTWIGANTAYIDTWYDQSGNGTNAVQTATADQGIVVNAGTLVTRNGKAAILQATTDHLDITLTLTQPFSAFGIIGAQAATDGNWLNDGGSTTNRIYVETSAGEYALKHISGGVAKTGTQNVSILNQSTVYATINGASSEIAVDGRTPEVADSGSTAWTSGVVKLGGRDTVNTLEGYLQCTVIFDSDQSANYAAIESAINTAFEVHWDGSSTSLLDTYSSEVAYSLRALDSAYTGYACRVRRSSDNDEIDIRLNFDGTLDTVGLEAFCSATDGFITDWYDQSGNSRDATQATTTHQPKIVASGSTLIDNSKAAIDFFHDGVNPSHVSSPTFTLAQPYSVSGVLSRDVTASLNKSIFTASGSTGPWFLISTNEKLLIRNSLNLEDTETIALNKQTIVWAVGDGANSEVAINGDSAETGDTGTGDWSTETFKIGARGDTAANEAFKGKIQELILYPADEGANKSAIVTDINVYYNAYWDGSQTGLLDTYAADVAYSLRALNSSYTGPLVKVRRSSDNAEQDIYALYDGTLDTETLEAFCSATDGFVTTWYDQSGNGDNVTQSTAASQPKIVASGTTTVVNSKPAMLTDGTDDYLRGAYTSTLTQAVHLFFVGNKVDHSGYLFDNNSGSIFAQINGDFMHSGTNLAGGFPAANLNAQKLAAWLFNGASSKARFNGSDVLTGDAGTNSNTGLTLGATRSTSGYGDVYFQEVVVFGSDQTSNLSGIESDINTYYSIY